MNEASSQSPKPLLTGPALPALGHALAGSTGAAISNVITYPLALIITRLQIQKQLRDRSTQAPLEEYKSIRDATEKIYNDEGGLSGLYTGVLQDTSKTIADSFLFFLAYNFIRQNRLRSRRPTVDSLSVVDELSVGFLAGAFSKFLTTPIANIVTRKQASAMLSGRRITMDTNPDSVRSIALQIRSEKGLLGFWSGYSASLVLTLNPSLTFFLFETFKRTLLPRRHRSDPPPQATFLLAAISKAIASTITYPFSLAKSRAQAASRSISHSNNEIKGIRDSASTKSPPATSTLQNYAPSNVFSTILYIAQNEGMGALYEGLGGEVLKGFFSNGITMLVKETVHKSIIQLYYLVLKLLKRYPNPGGTVISAKGQISAARDGFEKRADKLVDAAKDGVEMVLEKGRDAIGNVSTRLSSTKG